MKRGFRALAVLAAVAAMSAGPAAFATCLDFGGFAIFQCADLAYFEPNPAGAGSTISATFWQVGFGNGSLNDGSGSSGTGIGAGGNFNGNDNGVFGIDLADARTATGSSVPPVGAVCLRNNNWGNTGIDGCCDNPRDATLPLSKDGVLNPLYNVNYVRNYSYDPTTVPDNTWVQDSPMAALLRESTGSYFAVVAVSTLTRTGIGDQRPGYYNFKEVNDGNLSPFNSSHNIIPWQAVPGKKGTADPLGLVRSATFDTNNPGANHVLTLGWNSVKVFSDNGSRPSTNSTVSGGLGTAEVGPLVRYVVETQAIVDPNNVYGSLNPNGWAAAGTFNNPTNSTSLTVPADTCVRLHTYFGKAPTAASVSNGTCRIGTCGDLGYDVVSPASCLGGPLVSESPIEVKAIRERAGAVSITWKVSAELTTTSYEIRAVGKKGDSVLGTVPATATGTGTAASYKFNASATQLKGTRTIEIVAMPSGAKQTVQIK